MIDLEELRLSFSSQSTLRGCGQRFAFSKFYPRGSWDTSLAGEVGHCLHTGYQDYMVNEDRDHAMWSMMKRYPIDLNSMPTNNISMEACHSTMNKMMDSHMYMEHEIAQIVCLDGETRPAIEVPFEINIKGIEIEQDGRSIPVRYIGFIDAILYGISTGEYLVVDIKTTRVNLGDKTVLYIFDQQGTPYAMVLERVLGHALNYLQVNYMSVYIDIKEPKVTPYSFVRTEEDVKEWARGLLLDIELVNNYIKIGQFRRNSKSCWAFGRRCGYFDVCQHRENKEYVMSWMLNGVSPIPEPEFVPWISLDLELAA